MSDRDGEYVLPRHPDVPGRNGRLPEWPPLTPDEEAAAAPRIGEVEPGDD